jgi:hypothetical protein
MVFGIGDDELLGEVGEDAQPGRAGIDHEIDAAFLARQVELAAVGEGGGHHREYALVSRSHGRTSFGEGCRSRTVSRLPTGSPGCSNRAP